jgi:hypothetical protein
MRMVLTEQCPKHCDDELLNSESMNELNGPLEEFKVSRISVWTKQSTCLVELCNATMPAPIGYRSFALTNAVGQAMLRATPELKFADHTKGDNRKLHTWLWEPKLRKWLSMPFFSSTYETVSALLNLMARKLSLLSSGLPVPLMQRSPQYC